MLATDCDFLSQASVIEVVLVNSGDEFFAHQRDGCHRFLRQGKSNILRIFVVFVLFDVLDLEDKVLVVNLVSVKDLLQLAEA